MWSAHNTLDSCLFFVLGTGTGTGTHLPTFIFLKGGMAAASVTQTKTAIDAALSERGGVHATYSCEPVSWDDVSRGTVGDALSCWGANITDTYLKARDSTPLFTVRPENWNERLGVVFAQDVALIVGNCDDDGVFTLHPPQLRNVTLRDFLQSPANCGASYAGLPDETNLSAGDIDDQVSIRFQTVFLPVPDQDKASMQFATEAYNYNTMSDKHPRNLVLLCTTQGIALQADGKGQKRILHHARQSAGGPVYKFWLDAERSTHKVSGPQKETEEERQDAVQRGKAIADIIGIRAMDTRFNVLMTVQIPLVPSQTPLVSTFSGAGMLYTNALQMQSCIDTFSSPQPSSLSFAPTFGTFQKSESTFGSTGRRQLAVKSTRFRKQGRSNAARVSRGDIDGKFERLSVEKIERNKEEHVTVTVVFYNTVAGGVPTAEDVIAAIDDMESLLKACTKEGRLTDASFDFMKKPLTVDDVVTIQKKVVTQPPSQILPPETKEYDDNKVDEKELVLEAIRALENNPSKIAVVKARATTLGAIGKVPTDVILLITEEFDKLKTVGETNGFSSKEFRKQVAAINLIVRGALHDDDK